MDTRLFRWLVPQTGLLVRDPLTRSPLSEEGEWKPWVGPEGRVWRRRVKQGVVTFGQPPDETISPPIPEAAFRKSRKNKED